MRRDTFIGGKRSFQEHYRKIDKKSGSFPWISSSLFGLSDGQACEHTDGLTEEQSNL